MKFSISILLSIMTATSFAHEMSQSVGAMSSSDGDARSEIDVRGRIEGAAVGNTPISSSAYTLGARAERVHVRDVSSDDYVRENFPDGVWSDRALNLNLGHTFARLTDTRLGGTWQSDGVTSIRSGGVGLSQWWLSETLQTSVDVNRTQTDRPESSVLDYDRELVVLASRLTSTTSVLAVKHLSSPTTITSSSYTRVMSSDRPDLHGFTMGIRQYIPDIRGALHGSVSRLLSLGTIDKTTTTGQLSGWQAEMAFLKSLWKGAESRLGYRWVREDEFTRAYGDHLVFGADAYSLGITQELPKGTLSMDRPLVVHGVATRYIHNRGGNATLGEAGITVKF